MLRKSEAAAAFLVGFVVLAIILWTIWTAKTGPSRVLEGQIVEMRHWAPKSRSAASLTVYADVHVSDGRDLTVELPNWQQCKQLDHVQLRQFDHAVAVVPGSCRRVVNSR